MGVRQMTVQACRPVEVARGGGPDLATLWWVGCDHCGLPGPQDENQSRAIGAWLAAGNIMEDHDDTPILIGGVRCNVRYACQQCRTLS